MRVYSPKNGFHFFIFKKCDFAVFKNREHGIPTDTLNFVESRWGIPQAPIIYTNHIKVPGIIYPGTPFPIFYLNYHKPNFVSFESSYLNIPLEIFRDV